MGYCDFLNRSDFHINTDFHLIQRNTSDVIEQAEALPFWAQEYTQLSKGIFTGSIKSIRFNGIQLFSEAMNRAVDQIASAPQDCYVIGLPTVVEGESTWGHLPVRQHSLITLCKNAELYFRTPAISEIVAAVIPATRLQDFAIKIGWLEFEDVMDSIKPVELLDADTANRLLKTLNYGLHAISENPETINLNEIWASFEEDLLCSCIHALMHASKNAHPHYFDHRIPRYIVNRVRVLTLANGGFPLSIEDLCEKLRIKRRTLNQAFARALGITPLTYMRNLKLQKIRSELIFHPDEVSSIAQVASQWGFVHMSLFSRYYRELFGECPMETVQRLKAKN